MPKNENKPSHITLQTPGGAPFELSVLDIQALVALSPFVTDLLLKTGEVVAVEGSLIEIVEVIQQSKYPVFKNLHLDARIMKLANLDEYRRINYGKPEVQR